MVIDPSKLFKEFKVVGNEALVLCPFHDDHRPSASFNVITGMFYCFSCAIGKNIHQLCAELEVDEDSIYIEELKVKAKRDKTEWQHYMTAPLAIDNWYLQLRDVSNSFVEIFHIRECHEGIIFPQYQFNGNLTGVLLRRYEGVPKYQFFGERAPLWPNFGDFMPAPGERIFLTEGVFGALRALSAGLVAYAIMSASTIKNVAPIFTRGEVVTVFDKDYAGLYASAIGTTFGIPAAFPPFTADEASVDEWKKFGSNPATTRNFIKLVKLSKDPEKMGSQVSKFIRKVWQTHPWHMMTGKE